MKLNDIPKISRRSFLKTSAGVLAASGLSLPKKVHAGEAGRLATLIDLGPLRRLSRYGGAGLRLRLQDDQQGHDPPGCRSHPGALAEKDGRGLVPEARGVRPAHPVQLSLRAQGRSRTGRRNENLVRPEALHALRQPGLRYHLPLLGQSQARKRGGGHRPGPVLRGRQVQDGLPLGDPPAPVRRGHLPPCPAGLHGKRRHVQVRSLQ